jgi:hypothetical protein
MSLPNTQSRDPIEAELAELRAQVRVLADLLVECGVVDAGMIRGRLSGAAARARGRLPPPPLKKRGFFARLFRRREQTMPGAVPSTHMEDRTIPEVLLPFDAQVLYGERDLQGDKRNRGLTPTAIGKCERCWQVRPLSRERLCSRCLHHG